MKWILLLVLILICSPLWAAEQYTKAHCDGLKQQKELIRKHLNAGYGFAEGEQLDKQDRKLFRMIAAHCTSPIADTSPVEDPIDDSADGQDDAQETTQNHRQFPSKYANVSLQQMPAWSAQNAIFQGDKVAAWTEFYQVPKHCRKKQLSEAEFILCANHKAQQRELFEQKWQRLKFSPVNIGASQTIPSQTNPMQTVPQPVLESITAHTTESTISVSSTSTITQAASRYIENIQQQLHWVGIVIIIFMTVLSWLIWRQ